MRLTLLQKLVRVFYIAFYPGLWGVFSRVFVYESMGDLTILQRLFFFRFFDVDEFAIGVTTFSIVDGQLPLSNVITKRSVCPFSPRCVDALLESNDRFPTTWRDDYSTHTTISSFIRY